MVPGLLGILGVLLYFSELEAVEAAELFVNVRYSASGTFTVRITQLQTWGCNASITNPQSQMVSFPGGGLIQREANWWLCEANGIPSGQEECGAGQFKVRLVERGLEEIVVVSPPEPWPGRVCAEPIVTFDLDSNTSSVSYPSCASPPDPSAVPSCNNSQTYYRDIITWWEGPACVKAQRSFFSDWTGDSFCKDASAPGPPESCCANPVWESFEWQASAPGANQWGTIGFGQNITHIVSNNMDVRVIWEDSRGEPGARGVSATMFVPFCGPPP